MHIGFYITNFKNRTVELPVPPSDVTISSESDDSTEKVVKLGELNRIGYDKLKSIEIQTSIPVDVEHSHVATARNVWRKGSSYINYLQNIKDSKKACRIVLTHSGISLRATIQKFEYGFKSGNSDEYQIDINFVQYKNATARKITSNSKQISKKGKRRSKPSHKISRGATIKANGSLYRDARASGKTGNVRNQQVEISLVSKNSNAPYLIKSGDNTLGWIKKGAVI